MHKIPTDAFDMLVTLEKRPFERAGREVVVRLLDETLPDGTKLVAASDPSYPPLRSIPPCSCTKATCRSPSASCASR